MAKWQVNYNDVNEMGKNSMAASNVNDWVEDNILEARATALTYRVSGINLNNPFKQDGTPRYPTIANSDNATPATPVNTPTITTDQVSTDGATVDANTSAVVEGKPTIRDNEAVKTAESKVKEITERSKTFELIEDGKNYRNTKTGKLYSRVTSILSADETAGDRFDSNSPWILPSTNIGTSVDEFVRDFFAGNLKESYSNATKEQWNKFAEQLQILKNRFEAAGIHIVPRDIVAAGTLQIADAKENIHDVNVAGTLDLLAYNDKGEFFIFDMKTLHNPNSIASKRHKWGQQTSLYQKFLENEFGIKVKGRFIIPIQVSYPSPHSVNYEQGEGTQINMNGQEFRGANPNLMETVSVDYIEPNIMWDKMTEDERELASNITKESETPITEEPVEMQVKDEGVAYVDPNIGLSIDSDESSLFDDPLLNDVELPPLTGLERATIIPAEYQWENLTEEQRTALTSKNITKEQWETYQNDEMEHELKCLS